MPLPTIRHLRFAAPPRRTGESPRKPKPTEKRRSPTTVRPHVLSTLSDRRFGETPGPRAQSADLGNPPAGGPPEPRLGREVRPPSGGRFRLEEAFCRGTDASAPSIPVVSRPGPPRKRRTEDAERARSLRVDGPPKPRRARDPLGRGTICPGPASSVPSLPARRGRYGFVRATKALPLVEDTRAEPRGGGRPPSNRTSRSIYVVRGRNPGPNIPFFSRRDGPRHRTNDEPASSRRSTFLRGSHGGRRVPAHRTNNEPPPPDRSTLRERTGEGQTRRPAFAAARWADASPLRDAARSGSI